MPFLAGHARRTGPRGRWTPLWLLVLCLGIAAAAVVQAQRARRSHREAAERLVRDYGAIAAWSFAQHVREALRAELRAALEPAVHARDGVPAGAAPPAELLARGAAYATYAFRLPL